MKDKHKKLYGLCCLLFVALFFLVIGYYIGIPMIRLAKDPQAFQKLVDSYGIWSRLLFLGMLVLQVIVAWIPGEPVELLAGYAFGFWEGTILCVAGFLIGSWIIFLLVRKFGVKLISLFFDSERIRQVSFLKDAKRAKILAFLLMLIPGTPKDFLSYFAGLLPISTIQWLCIVAIARLPSLVTSTICGAAAGKENYVLLTVMLTLTGLITLLGIMYYRHICKKHSA